MSSPAYLLLSSLGTRRTWRNSSKQLLSHVVGVATLSHVSLSQSCTQSRVCIRTFAGHNKWSKIRHKKAANDKARAAAHAKATRAIEAASRTCHGDLSDLHLQSALNAARAVQLSKERMDKAVERGANPHLRAEGAELVVRRYDAMIPAGASGKVAVIIQALTENKNRTAANVRHLVTKIGGEFLPAGANDWLFEHVGVVWVARDLFTSSVNMNNSDSGNFNGEQTITVNVDALLECALEAGATDVDFGSDQEYEENCKALRPNDQILVKCEPIHLLKLVQTLQAKGYTTTQFENQWLLKDEENFISLIEEGASNFEKFLDSAEEDLDVTHIFHNAIIL